MDVLCETWSSCSGEAERGMSRDAVVVMWVEKERGRVGMRACRPRTNEMEDVECMGELVASSGALEVVVGSKAMVHVVLEGREQLFEFSAGSSGPAFRHMARSSRSVGVIPPSLPDSYLTLSLIPSTKSPNLTSIPS